MQKLELLESTLIVPTPCVDAIFTISTAWEETRESSPQKACKKIWLSLDEATETFQTKTFHPKYGLILGPLTVEIMPAKPVAVEIDIMKTLQDLQTF